MAWVRRWCLAVLLLLAATASAQTPVPRIALVIGNADYIVPAWKLVNPVRDAELMAARLEGLGFQVDLVRNATRAQMEAAFERFERRLIPAGPDAISVVYYAGHGAEDDGINYLVPVDADVRTKEQLKFRAPPAQWLLDTMAEARNRVNLLFLDACRDMPLPGSARTLTRGGLAPLPEVANVLIAYSAAPGRPAPDGSGRNSLFTAELAAALAAQANEPISLLMEDVQARVREKSGGAQEPSFTNRLGVPRWSFVATRPEVAQSGAPPPPPVSLVQKGREEDVATPSLTPAQRALRAAQAGEAGANRRFRDCPDCPEMVALAGGEVLLGSPAGEQGRGSDEGPQMRVTLRAFAAGRFEVTRAQYAAFTRETGRAIGGNCYTVNSAGIWEQQQGATWQAPGFNQTGDHPVVCVSWEDAQAYVDWLNGKVAGRPYRLLSESEWEYAARAGTTSRFWWGDGEGDGCAYANGADQAARSRFSTWTWTVSCNDGHVFTAPVGFSGRENRFGLADMAGNVLEWVQDCYNNNYDLTPTNGAANTTGGCAYRVIRGGAWYGFPRSLRSAYRGRGTPASRYITIGFRLSRAL
jgi:formylglycine-generating enzyme required for sulfatase activity